MTEQQIADAIAAKARELAYQGKLVAVDVPIINQLAASLYSRFPTGVPEPVWVQVARSLIGQREIVGPKHNSWIASSWARLGASWYNDDETPWCGLFVAHCLDAAKLAYPKNFPAAASFRDYGVSSHPQLGAIAVKARSGGNHVFFIVGETPDRRYFKGLGGNQSNAVSIADFLKTDIDAIRWPAQVPQPATRSLPTLPHGTISRNEA